MSIPSAIPGHTLDWKTNFRDTDSKPWASIFGVWGPATAGGGVDDDYEPSQVTVDTLHGNCSIVCRQHADGHRVSGGVGSYKAKPLTAGLWVVRARIISSGSIDSVLLGWPERSAGAESWPVGQEFDFVETNPVYDHTSYSTTLHHGADNSQIQAHAAMNFDVGQFHTYYLQVVPGVSISTWADSFGGLAVTTVESPLVNAEPHYLVAENLAQGRCTVGTMVLTHASQWSVAA